MLHQVANPCPSVSTTSDVSLHHEKSRRVIPPVPESVFPTFWRLYDSIGHMSLLSLSFVVLYPCPKVG